MGERVVNQKRGRKKRVGKGGRRRKCRERERKRGGGYWGEQTHQKKNGRKRVI